MDYDETIDKCHFCKHTLAQHHGVPGEPCQADGCECEMWVRDTTAVKPPPVAVKTAAADAREPRDDTATRGTFDDYADRVLDVLLKHRGVFDHGDPGEVLYNLADEAHVPYKAASVTMLRLERMGWIKVSRQYGDEARRANIILKIEIV